MTKDHDTLAALAAASAAYFRDGRRFARPLRIDEALLERCREERRSIRADSGGGGMCHLVTEWLEQGGCSRFAVGYLSREGEVICAAH